jgi:hypothetical protein
MACTGTDVCYKNCGPQNIGRKSETCTASLIVEMDGCSFDPAGSFACYKIPTVANAACPAGVTPQASQACTVTDACTLCNSTGGLAAGMYMDSNAMAKTGFCVCVNSKWTCASNTAWPCPNGAGCQ